MSGADGGRATRSRFHEETPLYTHKDLRGCRLKGWSPLCSSMDGAGGDSRIPSPSPCTTRPLASIFLGSCPRRQAFSKLGHLRAAQNRTPLTLTPEPCLCCCVQMPAVQAELPTSHQVAFGSSSDLPWGLGDHTSLLWTPVRASHGTCDQREGCFIFLLLSPTGHLHLHEGCLPQHVWEGRLQAIRG